MLLYPPKRCWVVVVPNREGKQQHRFDVLNGDGQRAEAAAGGEVVKRRWMTAIGEVHVL